MSSEALPLVDVDWLRSAPSRIHAQADRAEVKLASTVNAIPWVSGSEFVCVRYPKLSRVETIRVFDPYLVALLRMGEVSTACGGQRRLTRKKYRAKVLESCSSPAEVTKAFRSMSWWPALGLVNDAISRLNAVSDETYSVADFPGLRKKVVPAEVLPLRPGGTEVRFLYDVLDAMRRDEYADVGPVRLSEHQIAIVVSQLALRFDKPVDVEGWATQRHYAFVNQVGPMASRNPPDRGPSSSPSLRLTADQGVATMKVFGCFGRRPNIPADITLAVPPESESLRAPWADDTDRATSGS